MTRQCELCVSMMLCVCLGDCVYDVVCREIVGGIA